MCPSLDIHDMKVASKALITCGLNLGLTGKRLGWWLYCDDDTKAIICSLQLDTMDAGWGGCGAAALESSGAPGLAPPVEVELQGFLLQKHGSSLHVHV